MRRVSLILVALAVAGCQHRHRPNPNATIEDESELSSTILMSNPRDTAQLLSGFFTLESGAWRWTQSHFLVSLGVPKGAAERGARLELTATIPDAVANDLVGVGITPDIGGRRLSAVQLKQTGEQKAVFDVPAALLREEAIIVGFDLDKTVPSRQGDTRKLGLIVSRIALTTP